MRISDWSSDVCSSDLTAPSYRRFPSNTRSDLSFRSLPWFMDQSYQYPVTVTNEISYLCTVETVLEKKDIRAFSPEELKTVFERMGQPAYRATQVYEWLWKKSVSSFSEMTNISRELRERLEEQFAIARK